MNFFVELVNLMRVVFKLESANYGELNLSINEYTLLKGKQEN